jgi:hypothetical protein
MVDRVSPENRLEGNDDNNSWIWKRYFERAPKWEKVDCGIARTSQGHMNISTWRLAVPAGWIYKVTESDEEGHFIVQICFVPGEAKP